jgi:transposase
MIIGARQCGVTVRHISEVFGVPKSTVHNTWTRFNSIGSVQPQRVGRPRKTTERDDRRLYLSTRRDRSLSYKELRQQFGLNISVSTIKRRLNKFGIHKYIKAKRPLLTPLQARVRLLWCIRHRDWTVAHWRRVIWSDECSVERQSNPLVEWVFRSAKERWLRECVKGVAKSGTVKKMIWGCFAGGLKGTCGGMRVDMGESVTAEVYIRTLDFYLLDFVQELRERGIDPIFMQDNARVHTARITKDWLLEKNVEILEGWPPYSPDLNPIEHVWVQLKTLYHKHYQHLADDTRGPEVLRPLMEDALIHCWELIPERLFEALVEGMPRRIEAVIRARGWYTKY